MYRTGSADPFQRQLGICSRCPERRGSTGEDPREDRQATRRRQHAQIQGNGFAARQREAVHVLKERQSDLRKDDRPNRATRCKEQALDHLLLDQAGRGRADGRAQRQFTCPLVAVREQQTGNVGARDQHYASHRCQQHQEWPTDVASHAVVQRHHGHSPTTIRRGVLTLQPRGDGAQHLDGPRQGRRSVQATDHIEIVR